MTLTVLMRSARHIGEQVADALESYEQAREAVEASKHSLEGIPEEAVVAKVREARDAARKRVEDKNQIAGQLHLMPPSPVLNCTVAKPVQPA